MIFFEIKLKLLKISFKIPFYNINAIIYSIYVYFQNIIYSIPFKTLETLSESLKLSS